MVMSAFVFEAQLLTAMPYCLFIKNLSVFQVNTSLQSFI